MRSEVNENEAVEQTVCAGCATVPVDHLHLDLDKPMYGWDRALGGRGIEIVIDALGRRAISRADFGQLILERNLRQRRHVEEQRQRAAEAAEAASKQRPRVAVPALEGATPFESMMAAEATTGAYTTPHREFGPGFGSPAQEMLEDALADGRRRSAEKRKRTEERKRKDQQQ